VGVRWWYDVRTEFGVNLSINSITLFHLIPRYISFVETLYKNKKNEKPISSLRISRVFPSNQGG
jgi:hypothetical protein